MHRFSILRKDPPVIKARAARAKTRTPILPTMLLFGSLSKPAAKISARIPLIMSPPLNSGAVIPPLMPKSLKALLVQLNGG